VSVVQGFAPLINQARGVYPAQGRSARSLITHWVSLKSGVIPVKTGIHFCRYHRTHLKAAWIPVFTGMTKLGF